MARETEVNLAFSCKVFGKPYDALVEYEYNKASAGSTLFPFTLALFIDCFPNPL